MFEIIAFVIVCLVWQSVKDSIRGGKRSERELPTVRMGGLHRVAKCGCDTVDGRVATACAAHKILLDVDQGE